MSTHQLKCGCRVTHDGRITQMCAPCEEVWSTYHAVAKRDHDLKAVVEFNNSTTGKMT